MKKIVACLKKEKNQIIIFMFLIFISILLLNIFTPLIADDYGYSFGVNGRLHSFIDVIEKQIQHYFTWGGRSVAHTIAQTFLLFPKILFSIANSCVYLLLIWLIYLNIKGINKKEYPIILLLIHLCLWFVVPAFGQDCLWLIGSCNYLWTTTIILLFLYLFRTSKRNDNLFKSIGFLLLGIIAGWTNENTAFGLIVATVGILLISKFEYKEKITKWKISGLVGTIVGFVILIIAPGNYVRNSLVNDNTFIVVKLIGRILNDTVSMINVLKPLFILMIVLSTIYIYYKKKIDKYFYVFFSASILSVYAMVLSPTFPERAWFGIVVFMVISVFNLLINILSMKKVIKYILVDSVIILFIIYVEQFIVAFGEIRQLNSVWSYRNEYIERQKSKKIYDIKLTPFVCNDKHSPAYGLADITPGKDIWLNKDLARYFEVNSIDAK